MRTALKTVGAVLALAALLVMTDAISWRAPAPSASAQEALSGFSIRVEIDGIASTTFRGVEGIEADTEVTEFRDGATGIVRKLPGRTKYTDLVLRFDPKPQGNELWKWYQDFLAGKPNNRKNAAVVLSDKAGKEVVRYTFFNAWPAHWSGPRLVGTSAAVPVEEVRLTYDYFERKLP